MTLKWLIINKRISNKTTTFVDMKYNKIDNKLLQLLLRNTNVLPWKIDLSENIKKCMK